jgi:simple sugar transport system ATP-binding protein
MTKRFGSLKALEGVSLDVVPGSFHALLGENGAGKSTLVKCIMGFYAADAGEIRVGGAPVLLKSPRDAQSHGIGMVYQHFTLVENMTVAENLILSRGPSGNSRPRRAPWGWIDWEEEHAGLASLMAEMPFQLDPNRVVRNLAAGEKQKLEILKQLYLGSQIIILDEPTSVLTPSEADEVLGTLRDMTRAGRASVVMITHKFREVTAFCDEVTVLRKGRLAGAGKVVALSTDEMARMMVGSEPPKAASARVTLPDSQPVVLELLDVSADDELGVPVLRGVTLKVRAGEIVGVAGVSGNGQEELVEVLAGQRIARHGSVSVQGRPFRGQRRELRERKVRVLPESPLRNACVPALSVAHNIGMRVYDAPGFTVGGLVKQGALRQLAKRAVAAFGVRTPSVETQIGHLSGGNVQRAVLARELSDAPSVLVAANPCFGLDFGAVAEIRSRILKARNEGAAVLLISADLDEVFELSDRILVMSEGRIVHETEAASARLEEIGRMMAGHDAH